MSITDCDTVYGPGAGHLDEPNILGNPYPYGECTWYCWQFFKEVHNVAIPGNLGNGTDWVSSAHRLQWEVDQAPLENKIVCWSGSFLPPYGHVAVCSAVDGDGLGFWVREMNFKYYAHEQAGLTGKIDCRHVTDMRGVSGFITPGGVTVGGNGDNGGILGALESPLVGIGDSIRQAGLSIEAQVLTFRHKAISVAQIGGGMGVMAGGGVLAALTLAGKGQPDQGMAQVGRGVRYLRGRVRRAPQPEETAALVKSGRTLSAAERAWLAKNATMKV